MINELDITFLVLISLNIIVILLLGLSLYFIFRLNKKRLEEQRLLFTSNAYKKAFELLSMAQEESKKIISASNSKALELIDGLKTTTDEETNVIHQELESLIKAQLSRIDETVHMYEKEYENLVKNASSKAGLLVSETSDRMVSIAKNEISNFENALKISTLNSQDEVNSKIQKEYEKLELELNRYKIEKKKEIEINIFSVVVGVFSDIFKMGINTQEHERLIRVSLEEGLKERNIFNART